MTRTIQTERLFLRPYVASDTAAVVAQIGEYDVSKWLTHVPHPYAVSDALGFFDKVADVPFVYAVCRAGDLVGCVSIMGGDLGYWYGVSHWGQGYATEAGQAAVDAYFAQNDQALESGYLRGNAGSRRVLEKLGFVETEERSTYAMSRKCEVPNHRMVLSRQAWRARQ